MSKNRTLAKPGQYLAFILHNETMGVPVECVKEITQVPDIRPVPNAPDYVKGVVDIRGNVIPVVDLRVKFKMPPRSKQGNGQSCVIVLSSSKGNLGVLVDGVYEVIELIANQIDHPPEFISGSENQFVIGIGKYKGHLVVLVDLIAELAGNISTGSNSGPQQAAA